MIDFEKYGFKEDISNNQWYKEGDVIYSGLGQDENGGFSIELFTLCEKEDIGLTNRIIFRGTTEEMDMYLKTISRKKTKRNIRCRSTEDQKNVSIVVDQLNGNQRQKMVFMVYLIIIHIVVKNI